MVAVPVRVSLPVLVAVKVRSLVLPICTLPKVREVGETDSDGVDVAVPVPLRLTLALPPLELILIELLEATAAVGLKRTVTV